MRYPDGTWSPASKAFDEAIELSLEYRSPYPNRATFLDTDAPAGFGLESPRRVLSPLSAS
jgi:hypothetical protein